MTFLHVKCPHSSLLFLNLALLSYVAFVNSIGISWCSTKKAAIVFLLWSPMCIIFSGSHYFDLFHHVQRINNLSSIQLRRQCANQIYDSAKILFSWIVDLPVNYGWNKKLPLKEKASKKYACHRRMISPKKNYFPQKITSTKRNGYLEDEWIQLKEMTSTKRNGFH